MYTTRCKMYSPNVALCSSSAVLPTRGSLQAAGWDISSSESFSIDPGKRRLCSTGLKIKVPLGNYGRLASRSGLASKHGIEVGAGVIDSDYRGEIKVLLFNHSEKPFAVSVGDKIAQIIFEQINPAPLLLVTSMDETERGENGFGSTDMNPPRSPISIDGYHINKEF